MSLKIIRAGVLDTIQDTGRFGYQHLGINPGGAMDNFSAQLANALLGKKHTAPVIEIHFTASTILFEKATVICITGADFCPVLHDIELPINQPVAVNKNSVLEFKKVKEGMRCYLATLQNFSLPKWLNSYSTNLKTQAGGFEGRALQNDDVIPYENMYAIDNFLREKTLTILPFRAKPYKEKTTNHIEVIKGNEWTWLKDESKQIFAAQSFTVSSLSDRMGYRLQGDKFQSEKQEQLVSSAVNFGTLQLLPNGQLILLMADHQTTGGYPRIAHVISAHLSALAQMKPGSTINFKIVDTATAEQQLFQQHQYLSSVQYAASFNIEKLLS